MRLSLDKDGLYVETGNVYKFTIQHAVELKKFLDDNPRWLRPDKDWDNCPYAHHADDCNCRGMGGGR
jgi:hypothetical protein